MSKTYRDAEFRRQHRPAKVHKHFTHKSVKDFNRGEDDDVVRKALDEINDDPDKNWGYVEEHPDEHDREFIDEYLKNQDNYDKGD